MQLIVFYIYYPLSANTRKKPFRVEPIQEFQSSPTNLVPFVALGLLGVFIACRWKAPCVNKFARYACLWRNLFLFDIPPFSVDGWFFFQGFKGISSTMTIKYAGVHSRRLIRRLLQTSDYSFERKNPIHGNYSVYRFNRTSFYHHLTRCLPKSPWHSYNFHPKQLGASLARHSPMKHKSDSILLWLLTTSLGISCMATNQSFADRDSQRSALG